MESLKNIISYEIKQLLLGSVIISCLLILFSYFLAHEKNIEVDVRVKPKTTQGISQNEALDRADYHLKTADMNRVIQQFKIELENRKSMDQKIKDQNMGEEELDPSRYGIQLEQEYGAADVGAYLEKTAKGQNSRLNARDRIESRIAQQDYLKDYDGKYKKEFVNQFMNNMEEAGYDVQINDNLEVVRVRKIPRPDRLHFE